MVRLSRLSSSAFDFALCRCKKIVDGIKIIIGQRSFVIIAAMKDNADKTSAILIKYLFGGLAASFLSCIVEFTLNHCGAA